MAFRIGESRGARRVTVRTLHHYDQIGLVRASERTEAGHRRYSDAHVRRLYQVVALRSLGVPLARIAHALEGDGFTLKDAVTAQLDAVDAELLHARRLRRRLERTLEVLEPLTPAIRSPRSQALAGRGRLSRWNSGALRYGYSPSGFMSVGLGCPWAGGGVMALVTRGNFDDLDVRFSPKVADIPGVESLRTAGEAREATRRVQEADLVIPKSPEPRGLSLKSIVLKRGFEGYLGNIWNKKNEVFFVSHSYDLSASTPYVHPEKDADPSEYVISLRAGEMRELFMGSGAMLFPLRQVSSGIVVRLHIWESDEGSRSFGEAMVKVANTVEDSDLNAALKALSLANPTVAAIDGIKTAATTLSTLIGGILKENGDDFVDYYEGNYPVSKTWSPGDETYERDDSTIVVTRI